ncbi:MAG TPA: PIN domain-containing protein [Bryobacteraceae bacterium]|nr:PIN domain-containing protein [Bryobacteraceae bacterium]
MNVYVESNFVLERALEQEQSESCERVIGLATAGSVRLVIPAFSLAEPHITLMHKANERSRLSTELKKQLSELGRSKPYREASGSFNDITALLIRSAEIEGAGLERATDGILKAAEVIPLDSDVFYAAKSIQSTFDTSIQDSIVLASVVRHLAETKPAESCFLNRNTRDFDDPYVRDMLDSFNCKFFGRFDYALQYIEAQIRREAE